MRRIRLTTGPAALFGAALAIALILFLPLRLALGWAGLGDVGLSARAASGSIWWGSLSEARFGGVRLGDLKAGLSPLQLLAGRAQVSLEARDATRTLHGAIGVSRHGFGIDHATATLAGDSVFAPLPVAALELDDVSVRFQDGECRRAEGRVRATLGGDLGGIGLAQGMSGTARCEGGALLLPLTSQSASESIALRLWSSGRYRAELSVQPTDPAAAAALVLNGFQQSGQGYVLAVEGGL